MATLLDLVLLERIAPVFTWILVCLLTCAILEVTKILKNTGINAVAALCIAVIVGFSSNVTGIISSSVPWFIVVAFFVFLLFMIGNFMGIPGNDILSAMGGTPRGAIWWVIIPGIIIIIWSFSNAIGQDLLEQGQGAGEGSAQKNVILTLTHPKVLGLVLIILIGTFTITFMTMKVAPG